MALPKSKSTTSRDRPPSRTAKATALWKRFGPGLITGASDDDPSGIGTYAMAGAKFGYANLWLAWLTFPLMTAVQFMCAKIGMVSGTGISAVIRERYPRWVLYIIVLLLLAANTMNAGADILAIAAGVNLLAPLSIHWLVVPIGLTILATQIWASYRIISSIFRWLALSLIAYVAASFLARPDWSEVIRGTLMPSVHFDQAHCAMVVAILGTTISPYLFFWQASHEVEEEVAMGRVTRQQRRGATTSELKGAALDTTIGMFLSNVVMYFIILATGATLHVAGKTTISSAAEAAEALRPIAGDSATILMAIGLIATGLLAVPILTGSAGYAVCELFGWSCSLDAKPGRAKEFYIVIALSTFGGMLLNYCGVNPMDALFWTAVINGCLAPPLLIVILLIANDRRIMGRRKNGVALNLVGWATAAIMGVAAVAMALTT